MMINLPPALFLLAAALIAPLLPKNLRKPTALAAPIFALATVIMLPEGNAWHYSFFGLEMTMLKVDAMSRVFGLIFSIVSILAVLFAFKNDDQLEQSSALIYAGGALGVTFSGDFFSLYVFWELMAIASTFVILASRTKEARAAGMRYVMIHLCGGLFLLAGIILHLQETGSIAVDFIGLSGLATWLIFIGIAVNAAIPPLHSWLKDAYPCASYSGSVFLSAFTTKSAVYLMARTFPGTELLIILGAVMAILPIIYALLENNMRGVLSYILINQVGIMMIGIGIGTPLAINGVAAHAFAHILYKGLLFMCAGSVLYRTGTSKLTDLGGLYRSMPLTCLFTMIGALSISAPYFCGFVSKSMIISAAGHDHMTLIWLVLNTAAIGGFLLAGLKFTYFIFFGNDSGLRPKEAPWNMLLAMALGAMLCIYVGVFPQNLYALLPHPVDYAPYTADHIVGALQMMFFSILAFIMLLRSGFYPSELRAINLDTDWFYRKGGKLFYDISDKVFNGLTDKTADIFMSRLPKLLAQFFSDPSGNVQTTILKWTAKGEAASSEALAIQEAKIRHRTQNLAYPIGTGVFLSVIFVAFLSLLYFR